MGACSNDVIVRWEVARTTVITVFLLLLCSPRVSAQEPSDSTVMLKPETVVLQDSIAEPQILHPEPETPVILLTDDTDLSKIFMMDTLSMYSKHSPAKAAMMSAVLPGLGQIYNKKYWKIPIVYAAIGISAERFLTFQNQYTRYRRAYVEYNDKDDYTNYHLTLFPQGTPPDKMSQIITRNKDKLRTWRDWSIIAVVASYALNIIDANVDAHLMDFSLDDNISLNIRPCFLENSINSKIFGLTLQFSF